MSGPERRLVVGNADGPITDWPEWVSLDVRVEFELDDGTRVSTAEAKFQRGGPLDCSRDELAALPLAVELSDDVEAERASQMDGRSETDQ